MYDHGQKKYSRDEVAGKATSTGEAERRNADRHVFTASAEVVEVGSGARFSTRTTDLGPGGCFVDTMLPFPVGAKVRVTVQKGKTQFETGGTVVYSQTGLGMGIAFDTLEGQQRQALETWLRELTGGRHILFPENTRGPEGSASVRGIDHAALVRLVQLLVGKGMLTEAEGASVLFDPLM
ncbi:MAG TPA: PilZ domain-containing protein [Candidatus Acidoferrales bacterium]|nr:PilZ domain-containing protein [Candidatus Acidoferrales bacterium]